MSDKRPQILQAARELVDLETYGSLTMKQVADQSGISRATLYRYYSTKEELFSDVVYQWGQDLVNTLRESPPHADTIGERLTLLIRHVIGSVADNPKLMAAHIAVLLSDNPVLRRSYRESKSLMPGLVQFALNGRRAKNFDLTCDVMQHMLISSLILLNAGKTDASRITHELERIAAILLQDVWLLPYPSSGK